jgi:transposase
MEEQKLVCGIDVSKATLDICYNKTGHKKLFERKIKNNNEGHVQLFKMLGTNYTYIMENTGLYALKLNYLLNSHGADVRVENAMVIKRFLQMHMERNKSDKTDAKWIYRYALEREAPVWQAPTQVQLYCTQLLSNIEFYTKKETMFRNYLKSLESYPFLSNDVLKSCKKNLANIQNDTIKLETKLDAYLSKRYGNLKKNLTTIPGFGPKVVAYLIILTNGFKKFQNHQQLIAYAGLAPKEYSSGTMEAKKRICKMGNANLRKTLYMCSLTAIKCNKACKEQYTRLKGRGKNGKLALIAVCNKLLKQAFAIGTSGVPYCEDHISVPKH